MYVVFTELLRKLEFDAFVFSNSSKLNISIPYKHLSRNIRFRVHGHIYIPQTVRFVSNECQNFVGINKLGVRDVSLFVSTTNLLRALGSSLKICVGSNM